MMTHGEFYELIDSNLNSPERSRFRRSYYLRARPIFVSPSSQTSPMTSEQLEIALQIARIKCENNDPRYQIIVDTLNDELEKRYAPLLHNRIQQAQEELKRVQAENEQLRKVLTEAQAEIEHRETLIHQLQTQPLSEQLKKLTEMARQLEIDLESEKEARARVEAKAGAIPTGDGRTVHIHANTVNLNDIHHNDNNNTQINS